VPRAQRAHGIEHARFRNGEHREIDAFGQGIDAADAGAAIDFPAAAGHEMDLARIAETLEVLQHEIAERAGIGGRADDRNRSRLEHALDGQHAGGNGE